MKTRLRELAYLNKGLTIELADERIEPERREVFRYDGGIVSFVEEMNKTKETIFPEVIYFDEKYVDSEIEVAMQYNDSYSDTILAFANNINTEEGGTHLDGFKASLTKIINDYGSKAGILKGSEKLSGEDVREGLTAVISVKLAEPQFEGQTKLNSATAVCARRWQRALRKVSARISKSIPEKRRSLCLKPLRRKEREKPHVWQERAQEERARLKAPHSPANLRTAPTKIPKTAKFISSRAIRQAAVQSKAETDVSKPFFL